MAQSGRYTSHPLPPTPVSPTKEPWSGPPQQINRRQFDENQELSQRSYRQTSPQPMISIKRKSIPTPVMDQPEVQLREAPASPVNINPPTPGLRLSDAASINLASDGYFNDVSAPLSQRKHRPDAVPQIDSSTLLAFRSRPVSEQILVTEEAAQSRASSGSYMKIEEEGSPADDPSQKNHEGLQYHAFEDAAKEKNQNRVSSAGSSSSGGPQLNVPKRSAVPRPTSSYSMGSELRGRTLSPFSANGSDHTSPYGYGRDLSSSRRSPAGRPTSYIDLLNNVPYSQQVAPGSSTDHQSLQSAVGSAASLLDTQKTLEMYRANVKKTTDAAVQYEFAIFMINSARSIQPSASLNPSELVTEAKHILQRLSDRAYPFAQYYLADGYFSGLFNKDKPDHDKAFPLFVAASKHGHAESGYRAALCYEFGWGTTKSYPKAVQFYRNAASKNHPGAATRLGLACIHGDMGLVSKEKYREGFKWLKRAQESADYQYNAAPYELGILHLTGFRDDIFKDETYAVQLLTQAAELGHPQANFIMGQAYENGLYTLPRDAALSVHFYNGAATKGHPEAMMALCAWYMVGAEPVLERDEGEAYAWALQAADTGLVKAEYAVGYFSEMGVGCRRDPLGANTWYVRAAENGSEMAKQRLAIIRAAAAGRGPPEMVGKAEAGNGKDEGGGTDVREKKKKFIGLF